MNLPADLYASFDHYRTPLGPDGTPYAYYEALRDAALAADEPIGWSEAYGGLWVVIGWPESEAIQRNIVDFSNSAVTFPQYATPSGKPFFLSGQDEPDHAKYRRMVQAPFTRPRSMKMLGQLRDIARMLVDDAIGKDRFDAVKVVDRMPGYAFCAIVGLSMDHEAHYRRFVGAMVEGANDPEGAAPTIAEMGQYWLDLIRERRARPQGGLIDEIVAAEYDGERLSEEELVEFCTVLLLGGFDNTLRFLGNVFYRLAWDRELRRRLVARPELIPAAVDEFLRLDAPAATFRLVRNEVTVGKVTMKPGDIAGLIHPICNRDPRQFEYPDAFLIGRKTNRYMTFGTGTHHCLGAFLAHAEAVAMVEQFLARIPDFSLDPDRPARCVVGQVGGMVEVPVRVGSAG
jgi:hypothetical protein